MRSELRVGRRLHTRYPQPTFRAGSIAHLEQFNNNLKAFQFQPQNISNNVLERPQITSIALWEHLKAALGASQWHSNSTCEARPQRILNTSMTHLEHPNKLPERVH